MISCPLCKNILIQLNDYIWHCNTKSNNDHFPPYHFMAYNQSGDSQIEEFWYSLNNFILLHSVSNPYFFHIKTIFPNKQDYIINIPYFHFTNLNHLHSKLKLYITLS